MGAVLNRARAHDPARRVRARLEPGLPLLRCDPLLMAQLLDNLVDNALKYSPPEAPVELLVRQLPGQVLFAVRDRGPGVPPAWRERIFEAFQRGGRGVRTTTEGPGLGLTLSRRIVELHGGTIVVQSVLGQGATFRMIVPVRAEEQREAA